MNILDQRHFPFGDADGKELLNSLMTIYQKADSTQTIIQAAGLKIADYAWTGVAMTDAWPHLLESAARKGRLRVLVECVERDLNSAAYPIFGILLSKPPQSVTDRVRLIMFGKRRPQVLFDRSTLRKHIQDLTGTGGGGALILTGDDGYGKSHSLSFISYVLDEFDIVPGVVDFERWAGSKATPVDVMRDICDQLGWPMRDPFVEEPPDTQARVLLAWFKGRVRAEGGDLWILFDGPTEDRLTPAAVWLVGQIAVVAERHEVGFGLRVVLADFHARLLPAVERSVLRDPIAPIEEQHLRSFFEKVGAAAGQPIDEDAATMMVQKLLNGHPLPSPPPLAQLSENAVDIARSTFGLPEEFNG
ncbi:MULTISPECIES: effector-associated domain EAD1-containing protein [unclassified Streptomyces]|uniref:effector-associated domain EAD1-containing protein n=1 Tax=unclassified Streptomyces TaxID=2593676 RepID=UPI001654D5ED|nr:effector-associated domain EAD1-containing protein [Streptomyces sp. CB02980]MCB8905511.1 effector-associated domain EAD1-containing protein [Streptomyces sp. CB02980]